jgi:uncharacterized protein (DUF433 family)
MRRESEIVTRRSARRSDVPRTATPIHEDPRRAAAYGIGEAARYLRIPQATLRAWTLGQYYRVEDGRRLFDPVIQIADRERRLLSFINVVEAHVLGAIRRQHKVSLQSVRKALRYLRQSMPSPNPLADREFAVQGKNLFVQYLGRLIDVSHDGQLAMGSLLEAYLERIDWDDRGLARRLFLFTRRGDLEQPRVIVLDPHVSFGRPVLAGTGIPTAVVAQRFKGGESSEELAKDYGRPKVEIEEAIRCELEAA